MSDLFDDESLAILERRIDEWLAGMLARDRAASPETSSPSPSSLASLAAPSALGIVAIDHAEPDPAYRARWYVRMRAESKDFITVWLTMGQRTLRYETYVMPAPEENVALFNENLLRRNDSLIGAHFSIGEEDAVFLRGDRALNGLSEPELDRILGSMYAYVEQCFRPLLAIGFASRFSP